MIVLSVGDKNRAPFRLLGKRPLSFLANAGAAKNVTPQVPSKWLNALIGSNPTKVSKVS